VNQEAATSNSALGTAERDAMIDRLAHHARLRAVPRAELEWLAAHGELRTLVAGEFLARIGDPREIHELYIILAGRISAYVQRDRLQRKIQEAGAGEISGLLPFSRMTKSTADLVVDEPLEFLCINPALFPELLRECPAVTAACVHTLLDRAQALTESHLHDEKLFSLGKLAAGLAHELNNPAAAALRNVASLAAHQREIEAEAEALAESGLSATQRAAVRAIRESCLTGPRPNESPLERAEREDAIAEWLEAHGVESHHAASLADACVTLEPLETLANAIPAQSLGTAIAWIVATIEATVLLTDVGQAVTRIHNLIAAVKGFTQMDRPLVPEPMHIAPGVRDSVEIMGPKARAKSVTIEIDVPDDLPQVRASAAELNQVWASLLDNALDATPAGSHVTISAQALGNNVVLRVIDQGVGIAEKDKSRIFDPFFTTKPIGQGRGLGLDIARRIIDLTGGRIEFDSVAGRTEFRVFLPMVSPGRSD
jgi:signal transduction histidine kinase